MTTTKTRYDLKIAEPVAERLVEQLRPYCERIKIAGSIRRRKWDVGDIELLCIPKYRRETVPVDLFSTNHEDIDELDEYLTLFSTSEPQALFYKRRKSTRHLAGFGLKNKLMVDRESGIPVDVFTTDSRNWGMALMVRTGPADFVREGIMARLLKLRHKGHAYGGITLNTWLGKTGQTEVDCPDEETVFKHLKIAYQPPEAR